jgi:hypothetical protein
MLDNAGRQRQAKPREGDDNCESIMRGHHKGLWPEHRDRVVESSTDRRPRCCLALCGLLANFHAD